jgi:hypothetical protein
VELIRPPDGAQPTGQVEVADRHRSQGAAAELVGGGQLADHAGADALAIADLMAAVDPSVTSTGGSVTPRFWSALSSGEGRVVEAVSRMTSGVAARILAPD